MRQSGHLIDAQPRRNGNIGEIDLERLGGRIVAARDLGIPSPYAAWCSRHSVDQEFNTTPPRSIGAFTGIEVNRRGVGLHGAPDRLTQVSTGLVREADAVIQIQLASAARARIDRQFERPLRRLARALYERLPRDNRARPNEDRQSVDLRSLFVPRGRYLHAAPIVEPA